MSGPLRGMTAGFVARATGGTLLGAGADTPVEAVATDTRLPMPGACFVALRGPRFDGHDHLEAARAAGARLAIVARTGGRPADLPVIVVPDPRRALGALAAAWRAGLAGPVIAITGSVGKTTSKELLHSVLAARGSVAAAPSSWNNDVGLPLTLLSAAPDDEAVVAEIGTGAPGEIAALSAIARPDVALITAVGRAHLGAFGSVAAIATEKASLVDPMDPSAPVVANAEAPWLADRLAGRPRVTWYGRGDRAAVRLVASGTDADGPWCDVDRGTGAGRERFRLQLTGEHNALNACGVIAVAGVLADRGMAIDDEALHRGLAGAAPPAMRQRVRTIAGIRVHDDSWNASPESMAASLATFGAATRAAVAAGERRVLILGDMLELGDESPALHRELGRLVAALHAEAPVAALVLVGAHARLIGEEAELAGGAGLADHTLVLDDLGADGRARVLDRLRPGDHVLLKGSRGVGLDRVVRWLEAAGEPAPADDERPAPPAAPPTEGGRADGVAMAGGERPRTD